MYSESLLKYIPPEFDLSKYDKAANMELINWIENLTRRSLGFTARKAKQELLDEKLRTLLEGLTQENINRGILLDTPSATLINGVISDDDATIYRSNTGQESP